MKATLTLTCSKDVNGVCGKPAVALLLIRVRPETTWDAKPRCAEHPANVDAAMLHKYTNLAETYVVALREESERG